MSKFKKKLLITGGAGFIGSNFINYIHRCYPHYKILLLDALTYAGNLDNISSSLRSNHHFEFFHGNITHPDIVSKMVAESDIVVHFAAESHVTRSIYDNAIFFETDVIGTQVVANAVVNNPVELFVHISSSEVYGTALTDPMNEEHPLNPMSPYAAAKAGVEAFSKSLSKEIGPRGITVNCVAPGFIETGMTKDLLDKNKEKILENIPLNRIGTPEDVSSLTKFLASEEASYITGQTFHVNGGMIMS